MSFDPIKRHGGLKGLLCIGLVSACLGSHEAAADDTAPRLSVNALRFNYFTNTYMDFERKVPEIFLGAKVETLEAFLSKNGFDHTGKTRALIVFLVTRGDLESLSAQQREVEWHFANRKSWSLCGPNSQLIYWLPDSNQTIEDIRTHENFCVLDGP